MAHDGRGERRDHFTVQRELHTIFWVPTPATVRREVSDETDAVRSVRRKSRERRRPA